MANPLSTTQVLQILPQQGVGEAKRETLLVGRFFPPEKPGLAELLQFGEGGGDPMTEVGQKLVERLLREKKQTTPVAALASGLEPFDAKKALVIAASTHGAGIYDDLAEAAQD